MRNVQRIDIPNAHGTRLLGKVPLQTDGAQNAV